MWYVIPFAILLIILFILKKRESNKLNEKPTQATKSAQKIQESEQAPPLLQQRQVLQMQPQRKPIKRC